MQHLRSMLYKTFGIVLVISLSLALTIATAPAQTYPTKPIRFIVPFEPGGSPDLMARLIGPLLSKQLGVPVVMENHSGGGSIVGTEMVARSAPDGHTLLIVTAAYAVTAAFYKLPYDPVKSLIPVAKVPGGDMLCVAHPSLPANSIKELIALAKKQPHKLIFVTSGVGTLSYMATELFKSMTAIDFKTVVFKSQGPAMVDLLGGHSQVMISGGISFLPHIKSGALKALGTCGTKRNTLLPDVPTIAEAGVPGFDASSWFGILSAAGTPQPIVDRLNKELSVIVSSPEMQAQLVAQGAQMDKMSLPEFHSFIAAEVVKWKRVVKEANIKVEQ